MSDPPYLLLFNIFRHLLNQHRRNISINYFQISVKQRKSQNNEFEMNIP